MGVPWWKRSCHPAAKHLCSVVSASRSTEFLELRVKQLFQPSRITPRAGLMQVLLELPQVGQKPVRRHSLPTH
jgi:hypothetical protein